jgi:siroheme synthase-like protein
MLIDLALQGRHALIVGGGEEARLKAEKLMESAAVVTVLAEEVVPSLERIVSKKSGSLAVVRAKATRANLRSVLKRTKPRLVFISTGDSAKDEEVASNVRSMQEGAIVCVVDDPRLNDFNMPALARLGDVTIGVSTGGKSPAMAAIIRDKVRKAVPPSDVLQVRLQGEMRRHWKERLRTSGERKKFAYRLVHDERIANLLAKKDYATALRLAERMLDAESRDG